MPDEIDDYLSFSDIAESRAGGPAKPHLKECPQSVQGNKEEVLQWFVV